MTPLGFPIPDRRKVFTSLEERVQLLREQETRYTAFSPRPETRLALQKTPTSDTKISLNHKLRTFRNESTMIFPLDSFKTWIDAGHIDPIIPDQPDPKYNANVWRHFSNKEGISYPSGNRRVSSVVASMYPLQIPPPSRMGDFTYARFIEYGDIFRDPLMRKKQITLTEKEIKEMKRLNILSDARLPPTDEKGHIIPPLVFRRLKAQGRIKRIPMTLNNREMNDTTGGHLKFNPQDKQSDTVSLASRNTSLRHKGLLWKFSYKLNNPEYYKARDAQVEKERWKVSNKNVRELRKQTIQQELLASY